MPAHHTAYPERVAGKLPVSVLCQFPGWKYFVIESGDRFLPDYCIEVDQFQVLIMIKGIINLKPGMIGSPIAFSRMEADSMSV